MNNKRNHACCRGVRTNKEYSNMRSSVLQSTALEILAPAAEGVLQRWPVSKRVNSSKAPKDDETLTQPVDVVAPQLQV
jgi:hypothetical protein